MDRIHILKQEEPTAAKSSHELETLNKQQPIWLSDEFSVLIWSVRHRARGSLVCFHSILAVLLLAMMLLLLQFHANASSHRALGIDAHLIFSLTAKSRM